MSRIPTSLFEQVATECVPKLRAAIAELGLPVGSVSPSLAMTATIDVDGEPARVRLSVTLDPDEDEVPMSELLPCPF